MDKRAVLYARCSGDDRGNDGRNLESQLDLARQYATSKGYQVVAEIAEDDKGASGAAFELPGLNQVREMAAAGAFDVLVPREIDRLSRKLAKQLTVEEELKRAGVGIEYALAEYPDTPEGRFQKHVKASVAELEREMIAERSARGRRNKVKAGHVVMNGRPAYGYTMGEADGKTTLEIVEGEARIVRQVFTWFVDGDETEQRLTVGEIARRLKGTPTYADLHPRRGPARPWGAWSKPYVARMIKNETYAGVWHFGKRNSCTKTNNPPEHQIALDVPAIISREVWEAAQVRLVQNKEEAKRNRKYEYLLAGRITCGACGCKMNGGSSHNNEGRKVMRFYYRCSARETDAILNGHTHTCHQPAFRVDQVDARVWGWVRGLLADPAALDIGLAEYQANCDQRSAPIRERLGVVDDLLADNRAQLARLLDLYLAGDFPKDVLTDRKVRLETTIRALDRERACLVLMLDGQALTPEQIASIKDFASRAIKGIKRAELSFEDQRGLMEDLDVQITLKIEDGLKVAYASCIIHTNEERLAVYGIT